MLARTSLVPVDAAIQTPYKNKSGQYIRLASIKSGVLVPDAAEALRKLDLEVKAAKSPHYVTDCFRSVTEQAEARLKYDLWVTAGKPGEKDATFDKAKMKRAFVAAPGYSNHEAGRAIDDTTAALAFPGVTKERQLDTFWEIAKPLGWSPIIKTAAEGTSENWHFDFWGEWSRVYKVFGYSIASMCAHLDIGVGFYTDQDGRQLQAQLQRAGVDIGAIDGAVGRNTLAGAAYVGIDGNNPDWGKLYSLPTATGVIWKR